MTIDERAKEYIANCRVVPANKMGRLQGYIKGATEQRKLDIDKACEWLRENVRPYFKFSIDSFRKAMEEEP